MFRKPKKKELIYLIGVFILYFSALIYVYFNDLSFSSLYKYGLLQQKGIIGEQVRIKEIETPLSLNIPKVLWYIYIKSSAVLVELFQYWIVGMLIAAGLVVFVPWEKVKNKMGYGGFKSNFIASLVGAVIPICSCGIVPVLAGMVEAGIPLGPTMAFLISAPMLNIPAIFMTAGVLGWKLAIGRVFGTFFIALTLGQIISYWQKKERFLRRLIKINAVPSLNKELQKFAFEITKKLAINPNGLTTEQLAPGNEDKLFLLGEAGIIDRNKEGKWYLPQISNLSMDNITGACFVLPTGDSDTTLKEKMINLIKTAWDFFLQLNYYLVLAVLIAGAIKVIIPTSVIVNFVGGKNLNSVLVASFVAVLAYVCTYVEIPTALALIHKGMGPGATLSYLLGGPGLSLPSIVMLSGVFKPKVLSLYVIVSFIGCIIAGYIFNLF
ncbi:MAG: permease [Candidatus Omnitrophica bacterium]|nr:permease [Candidatus Omnitrophota bacterium]MCM8808997.1 permease [Candidatus Omnitrophota bacterium]